jgi:hypothetical protein
MTGALARFRFLERISLPAPFGLVFWDVATGTRVADGLSVSVALKGRPETARPLIVNRSAVWLAPALPGRSAYDLATGDWNTLRGTYRIEVHDPFGRFLPLAFDADLPSRGLYQWPGWTASPPMPLAPLGSEDSPPRISPDRIPLFSSPARPAPAALADVHCQLAEAATGAPAAWALVTVSHNGVTRGIGLADREGRAVTFFAYPERPRPSLATSPPAITDFRWEVEVNAFWDSGGGGAPDIPDLADVVAQLGHRREPLDSTLSPPDVLPTQLLSFGRRLILKTSRTPGGPSSLLFLGPD